MENFVDRGIVFPDVSFYQAIRRDQYNNLLPPAQQRPIDFLKMKQSGIPAVVIRAGQDTYRDSEFLVSWENAKIAGLKRASYWFLDKDSDVKAQARFYWNLLRSDLGEGFISGDIEVGSPTDWDKWYQFFNELQQVSGYPSEKIWMYTNLDTWQTYGPKTYASQEWFSKFGLWLAAWISDLKNIGGIKVPTGLKTPKLLQYGTPTLGFSLGVWSREIDMNLLNGGQEEFEKIFGKSTTETPPEPPIIITPPTPPVINVTGNKYKCTASAGLFIRPLPSTQQSPLGALKANEIVDEVSTNVDKSWIQIKTSNGIVGWCYSAYLLKLNDTPQPPTVPTDPTDGFWFVMHDWQIPPDYKLRYIKTQTGGTPEVFRAGDIENNLNIFETKLTSRLQYFWLDLNSLNVFGRTHEQLSAKEYKWLLSKWCALGSNYRAFTNKHGLDKFRNYPANKRMTAELPVLYSLLCGGASVKGTIVKNSRGIEMVKIQHFDPNNLPDVRTINIRNDPRIMFATNISNKKVANGYNVSRFPMFSEPARGIYRDSIVPIISTKDIYYPKKAMKWVAGSTKPNHLYP